MADVFLSYARKDTDRAILIRDALQALGLTVFFDTEGLDGGDVFPDVLDREVKGAGAVVGVWSSHALSRPWVKVECDIGRARGVLVPVQIETIPDLDKPAAFWNVQFDDLSDFDGDTDHAGWLRFVRSLARTLDRPELLQRESQTHAGAAPSEDAAVREELAALRAELAEMRAVKPAAPEQAAPQPPRPTPEPAYSVKGASEVAGADPAMSPPTPRGLPLPIALLISAVATNFVLYIINMLTTPMLIQSLMNEGQSSAQIGFTMTAIGVAKGLVFTVLGALLARRLHYRPGIAWLAAAAIGAIGYILTIGTTVWHASKFETPPDWLMMTLVSSLIITVIVSALAGLIATLLPFFKPKPDPTSAFD